ncbi:MAG: autoinducer binding domain-containing protein [Deltaproteobacteria bacterium]|nr:autoinducer binding domain-containing protein [Deltaproteobacteria bacterium]
MDNKEFSKTELIQILETIQTLINCRNEADIKTVLEKTKDLVCADYSICGLGAYDNKGLSEVKNIVNGSYPEGWFVAYKEEKLYEIDPIVWWQYKFFGTQIWADTYKKYKNKASPEFIYNANSFNLNFGISSGIQCAHNNLASITTFANSKNYFRAHQKVIVDILTPNFHQAILRVCKGNEKRPLPYLTPRESEIIQWIKEGKTNWEISMILSISERTVRFHLENIKNKLDATTKAHVVAIAMEQEKAD